MKDLFLFKTTQALENEEKKEINSVFGFKIIGKQIQLFSHRGELPTAHMIGHALRDSGIIDKYNRKHPYVIQHNSGQTGHLYLDLYYFPIISGNYIVDTSGPLVTLEGAAIKKKGASFEFNGTSKIAPEMFSKRFYINDFIDFILEGMETFICSEFKLEEIELKSHKMNNSPRVDQIQSRFNKELDCIFDCKEFFFNSKERALEAMAEIEAQSKKEDGFTSIGDVFRMKGCLNINKRYQPDYERFGWYYTPEMKIDISTFVVNTSIHIPFLEENSMIKMTMPEPVQKEEELIIVEEEK